MTKEQAIEKVNKIITTKFNNDYSIDNIDKEAIETVLSMLEEKDKIIGKMIDNIMIHYQLKTIRKMCCSTCRIEKTCIYSGIHRNCIKQYFENKAKELLNK